MVFAAALLCVTTESSQHTAPIKKPTDRNAAAMISVRSQSPLISSMPTRHWSLLAMLSKMDASRLTNSQNTTDATSRTASGMATRRGWALMPRPTYASTEGMKTHKPTAYITV